MTYTTLTFNGTEKLLATLVLMLCLSLSAATITLAWNPSAGADGYSLSVGVQSGQYFTNYETTNCTLTVSNLDMAKTYFFAVRAESNDRGYSDFSSEVSYFVPPPSVELHIMNPVRIP